MSQNALRERDAAIVTLRESGQSFADIANTVGVGPQRVRQIYNLAKMRESREPEWWHGLSVRVYNVLWNANIRSKEEARRRIVSRDCWIGGRLKWRNFGWKSYEELCLWCGLPKPVKPAAKIRVVKTINCPHCGKPVFGANQKPI